jgi:hypothetical protein
MVGAAVNAPIRASDCIGELCIALAYRWESERLFVIFTAYFDEADTHGAAPTVILAAFLGHAFEWRRFEQKLAKLQRREGFSVFHAKDFKAKSGEFSGWSDEKCKRVISKLTGLVQSTLTEGMAFALTRELYLLEYRAPPIPRKMHLDSQYGVCFRVCMGRLFDIMAERSYQDRLNIVMERGHENVWDCERIFNDLRSHCKTLAGKDFLGSFSVRPKDGCPPLMVADMLAATYSIYRAEHAKGAIAPDDLPATPQTKGRLAFLELRPDALKDLKIGFDRMRQLKIEHWREQRNAKKIASGFPF